MPPRRIRPLTSPVHLTVDGRRIVAERGEPITVALTAAGRLTLGRSVKYHRPRGAACYSGRCDGCLMRVDGVPSVTTCRTPAQDGMRIETQNVVGSARRDLLAATDWFFPDRMNHHKMFTWSEAANKVMQKVARRIAGIGVVPSEIVRASGVPTQAVDVLVIGGGPAGLYIATKCAELGRSVMLVEESFEAGGSLGWWPGATPEEASDAVSRARASGVEVHVRRSAIAIYDPWEDVAGADAHPRLGAAPSRVEPPAVIVAGPDGLERYYPAHTVIATGRHFGAMAFEEADRPGVVDLRAACLLLQHGVCPGDRVAMVGDGAMMQTLGAALADALRSAGAEVLGPFPEREFVGVRGRPTVSTCLVRRRAGATSELPCDAVVVAAPSSAVYELAAQAGVHVKFEGGGYELGVTDSGGTAAADVSVVGWASGPELCSLESVLGQAERAASAVVRRLGGLV